MDGGEAAARAVVVDDQIVNAQNALVIQKQFPQTAAFFRVGLAAQQPVHRVPADLIARLEHDQRHHQTDIAIDAPAEQGAQPGGDQHRAGSQHVAQAVLGGGQQGAVVGSPAQTAIEEIQPCLHRNGNTQHRQYRPRYAQRRGREDGLHALLQEGKGHHEDQQSHAQRAQILHPAVAEGMLRIHGLTGHAGGDQRHNAARRVGQVVVRVRQNGHRAAEKPDQKFAGRQKQVDQNAHAGAQRAIGGADFSVFRIFIILHKTANQPCRHFSFLHCAPKDADFFSL